MTDVLTAQAPPPADPAGPRVRIHSVLDPTLVKVTGTPNAAFTPTTSSGSERSG